MNLAKRWALIIFLLLATLLIGKGIFSDSLGVSFARAFAFCEQSCQRGKGSYVIEHSQPMMTEVAALECVCRGEKNL